jgi:diadenosine tetraphosphatase ApaH/serine/threonine PP2A family protein phosphatase
MAQTRWIFGRMRLAFLADIHANREALDAVLDAVRRVGADEIVILGDLVGYGPDPAYAVETIGLLAGDGAVCVQGNHDEAAFKGGAGMTPNALRAIEWTAENLGSDHVRFLRSLPLTHERDDMLFVHASASDPGKWRYIRDAGAAAKCLASTQSRLVFCGHTHFPAYFHALPDRAPQLFVPISEKPVPISSIRRAVIVVGSVGQPRDRVAAGCFGLYDTEAASFTSHRVPYPADITFEKIRAAGLPEWLGMRLLIGR